jgi:hypothetical protein
LSSSLVAVQQPSDHHKQHTSSWYYNLFTKHSTNLRHMNLSSKIQKLTSWSQFMSDWISSTTVHAAWASESRRDTSLNVNPGQKLTVTTTCKRSSTFLRSHSSQLV